MCAIQRVNGQDKIFKCLWTRYVSRCQAHRFVSRTATLLFFLYPQQFPVCIKNGPPPNGHPANLTQLWEALESTWDSILVERFRHLVVHAPTNWVLFWGQKRGQLNIRKVFRLCCTAFIIPTGQKLGKSTLFPCNFNQNDSMWWLWINVENWLDLQKVINEREFLN